MQKYHVKSSVHDVECKRTEPGILNMWFACYIYLHLFLLGIIIATFHIWIKEKNKTKV